MHTQNRKCDHDSGRCSSIAPAALARGIAAKRLESGHYLEPLTRNASCPVAPHVMRSGVSRYRTLIEWSLSALAVTTIVVVMLSADTPVRQYATSMGADVKQSAFAMQVPAAIESPARTAWRICMDHKPLASFAGVAIVLVVFMRRMR